MSLQRACCCAGPDPDPLICCTCPASSYSIALDIGWTSVCFDPSGNFGTVDVAFSYSGWTVVAGTCYEFSTVPPGQHNALPYTASGPITNASVSLGFSSAVTCASQSISGATLNSPPIGYLPFACSTGPTGWGSSNLGCHHYRKADGTVVYRWFHLMNFETVTLCPGGIRKFIGCVSAMSPEQATCHAPPSSGWTDIASRIHYCFDTSVGLCAPSQYSASTNTNKTFSLTIT